MLWENTAPGTKLSRIFCAVIGLLQLGVVLVSCFFNSFKKSIISSIVEDMTDL